MAVNVMDGLEYRERIGQLNDRLRQTFWGGEVMTTPGVNELPELSGEGALVADQRGLRGGRQRSRVLLNAGRRG